LQQRLVEPRKAACCNLDVTVQLFRAHMLKGVDFAAEEALASGVTMHHQTSGSGRTYRHMTGRQAILQYVRNMTTELVQHQAGSLLMLSGNAGYGKTKILQHLAKHEEYNGYRSNIQIFRAAGTPERRPVPLTPWRTILVVCPLEKSIVQCPGCMR
jgi:hypothetical protein